MGNIECRLKKQHFSVSSKSLIDAYKYVTNNCFYLDDTGICLMRYQMITKTVFSVLSKCTCLET